MGTSIVCSSNHLPTHLPSPRSFWGGLKVSLCGLVIQKVEGLFVADSRPDSIQRSITCQTSADGLRRLLRLRCQGLDLSINLLIANLNLFLVRDLFQQQRSFHF